MTLETSHRNTASEPGVAIAKRASGKKTYFSRGFRPIDFPVSGSNLIQEGVMVVVEVIMQSKMILVGPFENHNQSLYWVQQMMKENPGKTTILAVNDNEPDTIRAYVGDPNEEPSDLLAPTFDLFKEVHQH
jgi:hypothetical protein